MIFPLISQLSLGTKKVLAHWADQSIELRVIQVLSLSVSFSTKNTFMTIQGTVFLGFGYDFGI